MLTTASVDLILQGAGNNCCLKMSLPTIESLWPVLCDNCYGGQKSQLSCNCCSGVTWHCSLLSQPEQTVRYLATPVFIIQIEIVIFVVIFIFLLCVKSSVVPP